MYGRFKIFSNLSSSDDKMLASKRILLYKGNLLWVLAHEKITQGRPTRLNKPKFTSRNFDDDSFGRPLILV